MTDILRRKPLRFALPLLLAACAQGAVTLSNLSVVPGDNGEPTAVSVDASSSASIEGVYVVFRITGSLIPTQSSYITNALALTTGTTYAGVIPPLPEGVVDYFVYAEDSAGVSAETEAAWYQIGEWPDDTRATEFNTTTVNTGNTPVWTRVGSTTNYYCTTASGDQWTASGVLLSTTAGLITPGGSRPMAFMYNYQKSVKVNITSPILSGGLGTIYYTSKMADSGAVGEVVIQITTNSAPLAQLTDADWTTIRVVNYTGGQTQLRAVPVTVNRYDIKRVRFWRTGDNEYDTDRASGRIVFDNIVLSKPPTDILLTEHLRNPGYPSRDQEIRMRCAVSNVVAGTPAVNVRMYVVYQRLDTPTARPTSWGWNTVEMAHQGDGLYEGVIPAQSVGYVSYYYRCEFDGYAYGRDPDGDPDVNYGVSGAVIMGGEQPFHDETKSPVFFANGTTLPGPEEPSFYSQFQVRPFRSDYGTVAVVADPDAASVANMTLVGDHTWQATPLVTGLEHLEWYFVGYNRYTNDAPAFSTERVVWGEDDQSFINPPLGGFVEMGATNPVVAELTYNGFLLMRFSTESLDYIAKRAVYQDFDEWEASEDVYEESLGLYATQSFETTFDDWSTNIYYFADSKGDTFQYDVVEDEIQTDGKMNMTGWQRTTSQIIEERLSTFSRVAEENEKNHALLLNKGGNFGNSSDAITYGANTFDFRARASISDKHFALYKGGASWDLTADRTIKPTFSVGNYADSKFYVSFLFCYQDGYGSDEPIYYELRAIQDDAISGHNNVVRFKLYRHNIDGTSTPLSRGETTVNDTRLTATKTITILVSKASATSVRIRVDPAGAAAWKIDCTDTGAGDLVNGGTVGVGAYDCVPLVTSYTHSQAGTTSLLTSANQPQWHLGGKRTDNASLTRWSFGGDTGSALTRVVPPQTLRLYTAPRVAGTTAPTFAELALHTDDITVNSFSYQTISIPLKLWNQTYVQLRHSAGDAQVVIDDARLYPWRAETRQMTNTTAVIVNNVEFREWTSVDQQNEWLRTIKGWAVLEGWVTNALTATGVADPTRGNEVVFERTRANTNLVQGLVSPVLENGIGSISFTYEAKAGNRIVYAVEYTDESSSSTWLPAATFTNAVGDTGSRYTKIAENYEGRIRVRILPESDPDACIAFDNLLAKDYPPRDDTTWQAYNAKITGTDTETGRLYNGLGRSAYLNNSATDQVAGNEVLTEYQPFIQTPSVGTGIGEIAFQYRSYTPGEPAWLIVKGAPSATTPEENWVTITNLYITNGEWEYFDNQKIYDLQNKVVRFYSVTNHLYYTGRVSLDDILVTEPVRAGYEISSVTLDPVQPLAGSNVNLRVEIGRFLMNPQGIELYCSYHVGTNVWGYTNWWTRANTEGSSRILLQRLGGPTSRTYVTTNGIALPAGNVDDVFQFIVWGIHNDIAPNDPNVIFQTTDNFENPAWYAPINLNETYASQGWSPYYYVYSCPPGTVWFNEVQYRRSSTLDTPLGEFIELAGRAGTDISSWRIDYVSQYNEYNWGCQIPANTKLPNDYEGWGFFVWGDDYVENVDVSPLNPEPGRDSRNRDIQNNGGLILSRSNGAWEYRIYWGTSDDLKDEGFIPIFEDLKSGGFGLSLTSTNEEEIATSTYDSFKWAERLITPGAPNVGQLLEPIGGDEVSYLLTAYLNAHGTQNGSTQTITVEVPSGASTSIVYVASQWYRIEALTANNAAVAAAAGQATYTYEIASMSEDVTLDVTFSEWAARPNPTVPVSWLSSWTEAEIAAGDQDSYSVEDEYLLNTDPTADTTVSFAFSAITAGADATALTVTLERSENEVAISLPINGLLSIYGATTPDGQYAPVQNASLSGAFDGKTSEAFSLPLGAARFYQAIIEAPAE